MDASLQLKSYAADGVLPSRPFPLGRRTLADTHGCHRQPFFSSRASVFWTRYHH
ncbi:hypothetical protein KCP73_10820 [Salmonella enterica subsp. enterica]|nr:hypothetical protein KCP73_10820 [Salmonella enterica subsp. enterica]